MVLIDFYIPDTSPLFSYTPCSDCSPSAGWRSAYAPRSDGYDQTFHQTQGNSAAISFNISATNLAFSAAVPFGDTCSALFSINGSTPQSACGSSESNFTVSGLPAGMHQVVFQPRYTSAFNSSLFEFFGVSGQLDQDFSGNNPVNSTYDTSTGTSFVFSPSTSWTQLNSTGPIGGVSNQSMISTLPSLDNFAGGTMSVTTAGQASASMSFKASAIYLFGMSGPEGGNAQISLDGVVTNTLNLTNPWRAFSSLLYMNSGLDPTTSHTLTITNTSPGQQVILDYAILTNGPSISPITNLPLILGVVAGSIVGIMILGVLIFLFVRRVRNSQIKIGSDGTDSSSYAFAKGISYENATPSPKLGWVARWRKQTRGTMSEVTTNGPKNIASLASDRSPSPDYIPYNGPISNPPPITSSSSSAPTTWIKTGFQTPISAPSSSEFSNTDSRVSEAISRGQRRPAPLPLSDRFEDIAMNDYDHQRRSKNPSIYSPAASTPSTIGVVNTTTARAVNGRRSVATLLPTSVAVSSTQRLPRSEGSSPELSRYTSQSSLGNPSSDRPFLVTPSAMPESPNGTGVSLRRGVSVKSVKTMRSFFSSLLTSSNNTINTSVPMTPAVPGHSARPDSETLPRRPRQQSPTVVTGRQAKKEPVYEARLTLPKQIGSHFLTGQTSRPNDTSPDFFFELNPNSPITASRPGSYMTNPTFMSYSNRTKGGRV